MPFDDVVRPIARQVISELDADSLSGSTGQKWYYFTRAGLNRSITLPGPVPWKVSAFSSCYAAVCGRRVSRMASATRSRWIV